MPAPSAMTSGRIFSLDEDPIETRLLDVQHLAEHGQDRLEAPIAALLGRATGGVALDDVELAARRIAFLAVGELAGQRHPLQRALADDEVAGLACRLAGARGGDALLDDPAPVGRVLFEVLGDALGDDALDDALDIGVAELRLGLALELRIGELDADDRRQPFADVIAGQVRLLLREGARLARPRR